MYVSKRFIIYNYIQEKLRGRKAGSLVSVALEKYTVNLITGNERYNENTN